MPEYDSEYQRMPACLRRIQPMPNLPLAYVSVYQRMSENFIRNSYVSLIRNSVTGPITINTYIVNCQQNENKENRTKKKEKKIQKRKTH